MTARYSPAAGRSTVADKEPVVWGIHAGKTGDADTLFLKKGFVALGWTKISDLSKVPADRESFKQVYSRAYPEAKPGAVPTSAGQLFRFIHEMAVGDVVAYPSRRDRQVHLGRVEGPYRYDAGDEPGYPHVRPAKWIRALPRTHFSQGALYEIGSAMSFFQIKTHAVEFRAALSKGEPAATPVLLDETLRSADEIEQETRDFVLKRLATDLKGPATEELVENLLKAMGYRTRAYPDGPNSSPDIVAHRDEFGLVPPIIKVEVKSGEGDVDEPTVAALYGKTSGDDVALIVTVAGFTGRSKSFARGKSRLRLVDGEELLDLLLEHYDELDAKHKRLLPLRKVYVPDPPKSIDE